MKFLWHLEEKILKSLFIALKLISPLQTHAGMISPFGLKSFHLAKECCYSSPFKYNLIFSCSSNNKIFFFSDGLKAITENNNLAQGNVK